MASVLYADTDETIFYSLDSCSLTYNSHSAVSLSWIFERYDFDWIVEYVDQYYGNYYKNCERFLTGKQREIAGKFGLSNIFFKPDFRVYENTKIVLTKRLWHDRLRFRYLAPLGDVRNFDVSVAVKPYRFVTVSARGNINGETSIAIVVNKPLGRASKLGDTARRTKSLLGRAKQLANSH